MGFDLKGLAEAVRVRSRVVRVVVCDVAGSTPREVGAAMLVWEDGQSGTIGGGALEYRAAQAARDLLAHGGTCAFTTHALGPDMGQCCGGKISLLAEVHDKKTLSGLSTEVIARPVDPRTPVDNPPLAVARLLAQARNASALPTARLVEGWMIEPVARPGRAVWIWGAGHVGRALVDVLAPLPDLALTWIDTAPKRFPDAIPEGVTMLPAADPVHLVAHAPRQAEHLVLTYSHALDLALCHALLGHGFGWAGLIGSATKWARFRSRLAALGHAPDAIAGITCPIGTKTFGKHPQAIAIGVAAQLITGQTGDTGAWPTHFLKSGA
jgi:xanthine dehydrogenase accessory factor